MASSRQIQMIKWSQVGAKLAKCHFGESRTKAALVALAALALSCAVETADGQVSSQSQILTGHLQSQNQNSYQQQQIDSAAAAAIAQQQAANFEQQLAALAVALGGTSQGQQSVQSVQLQLDPISQAALSAVVGQAPQQMAAAAANVPSEALPAQPRSRSPRSIGEMFKKFFTSNKRSKQSSSASAQSASTRDWEQQQLQQQQQHQQFQQNQAATMAATLAAAAANQHAVYASPFAAYTPAQSSASALYSQFTPAYSSAGLVAWPAAANLAQAFRGAPTLIAAQSSPPVALAGSAGPLYAAASQSYNSYVAPPAAQQQQQAIQQAASSQASQGASGGPIAAASQQHASAVPPPQAGGHGAGGSSLDFHQVLDALVRTSGFAPAGDSEAAAASGYGAKTDGTPVFSFKKLVSLPFYLSTEEKSLDGLANAGPAAGYSLHSMPIMRRHVRRMSTPASRQQQAVAAAQQQMAAIQQQQADSQLQTRERARMQQYNSYMNAVNNQLASMSANQQLIHYLNQHQQSQPSLAGPLEAYAADAAQANYQALASLAATPTLASNQQASASSYKSSGIGNRNSIGSPGANSANLAMTASSVAPMAVQAPQGLFQQQQAAINQNLQQQQEIRSILGQLVPSGDSYSPATNFASYPSQFQSLTDGHRLGAQQQQQSPQYFYWASGNNQQPPDESGALMGTNGNGNTNSNNGQEYLAGQLASSAGQQQLNSISPSAAASNLMEQHQQQQQVSHPSAGNSQSISAPAAQVSSLDSNAPQSQQQVSVSQQSQMSTQHQQQSSLGSQQQQQLSSGANLAATNSISANNNFGPAAQIEGQQQK